MSDQIEIRDERDSEKAQVHGLHVRAFESDVEAGLVERLRASAEPLVSLVAVERDCVLGHILFSPVRVGDSARAVLVLGLGPMAVLPDRQRQGIGGRLVREGLRRARALKTVAVLVLGHPGYYPRFGFRPASDFGLTFRGPEYAPYFMAMELRPGGLRGLSGEVRYHPAFEQA